MNFSDLSGKKILIAGYGREGKSVYTYLKDHVSVGSVAVTDMKDGPDYLNVQSSYDIVIKSPGIRKSDITVPYTTPVNLFFANVPGMKIGITGTKGKSTTSSLIYDILAHSGRDARLVGNIGIPWFDAVNGTETDATVFVCELSSYQLDDIRYSPHISVFVSLFPDHLDYHGDFESYVQAKSNIVSFASSKDFAVYNPAYPKLQEIASRSSATPVPYVQKPPVDIGETRLSGVHNLDNIRAASTVASILGIETETVVTALKEFKPLPHRLEKIGEIRGVTWIDDAISTTPESTSFAIDACANVSVIFLGGTDRGYDFSALVRKLYEARIRHVVLFPESGEKISAEMKKYPEGSFTTFSTNSMKDAVAFAARNAKDGSTVLLSTASPSYSLWKNFEHKGDEFQQCVRSLGDTT